MSDPVAPGTSLLDRLIERIHRAMSRGPALQCRPHRSRQRLDLAELAQVADMAPDALLAELIARGSVTLRPALDAPPPELADEAPVVLDEPGADESGVDATGVDATGVDEPGADEPSADEPGVDEPSAAETAAAETETDTAPDPDDGGRAELAAARRRWRTQERVLKQARIIAEDARTRLDDTGVHALYLGYALLDVPPAPGRRGGRLLAPIAMLPLRLDVRAGRHPAIVVSLLDGADRVVPNPALVAWIEQEIGAAITVPEPDEDPGAIAEIDALVAAVCDALELPRPERAPDAPLPVHAVPRTDDRDTPAAGAVLSGAVLGLYPMAADATLRDLRGLRDGTLPAGPAAAFTRLDAELVDDEAVAAEPRISGRRDIASERFIDRADPCQARAVALAGTAGGLVVHGPPGTGKSQTILNVIGAHLARGERVLVVCDKRTALDVVHNRLVRAGLGGLCAVVHDAVRDRRDLYMSVRDQLDNLPETQPPADAWATLDAIDAEMTSLHAEVRALVEAVHVAPRPGAPSLHQAIGRWLERADAPALDPIEGVEPDALGGLEVGLREALDRAARIDFGTCPWVDAIGVTLDTWLSTPIDAWRARLDVVAEAGVTVDAARDPSVHPFVDRLDVRAQAAARAALADIITDARARIGDAAIETVASRGPAGCAELVRAIDAVGAWVDALAAPVDPAMAMTLRRAAVPATQRATWKVRLGEWLELSSRWWGVLLFWRFFPLKRAAGDAVAALGRPLSRDAATAAARVLDAEAAREVVVSTLTSALGSASITAVRLDGVELAAASRAVRALAASLAGLRETVGAAAAQAITISLSSIDTLDATVAALRASQARAAAIVAFDDRLGSDQLVAGPARASLGQRVRAGAEVAATLAALRDRAADVEHVLRVRSRLSTMPGPIAVALERLAREGVPAAAGTRAIERATLEGWIRARLAELPAVHRTDGERVEAARRRLAELEAHKRHVVGDAIRARWIARQRERLLVGTGTRLNGDGAAIRRRLVLRGRHATRMRQALAMGAETAGGDPLFDLRPVWMAGPLTVSEIFEARALFDIVIFDEASQCRLEEALPVMARGRRVMIAGDQHQLPPTRFFESTVAPSQSEVAEDDQALFEQHQAEVEDLLGAALNLQIEQAWLDVHYRSKNAALIDYSNHAFYGGRLQALPGHPSRRAALPPVRLLRADGTYDRRQNPLEADAVAALVRDLLAGDTPPTIGVACFSLNQRDAILDAFDRLADTDPEFAARLAAARGRDPDDEPLFVKNLESVQGDERDHIVISTTYGPDPAGRFYRRFGPLGRAGGGRRLNVLVTRARELVHVVTSIPAEAWRSLQSVPTGTRPNGTWHLFAYLAWAEQVGRAWDNDTDDARAGAAQVRLLDTASPSVMTEAVADRIVGDGDLADVYWGNEGFGVDVAVTRGDQVFGVLVDATRFARADDVAEWDMYRIGILEMLGWQLQRVWSPAVFRDPDVLETLGPRELH